MNRSRVKLKNLRHGHTIYEAIRTPHHVTMVELVVLKRPYIYPTGEVAVLAKIIFRDEKTGSPLEKYAGEEMWNYYSPNQLHLITFCKNKALRWAKGG